MEQSDGLRERKKAETRAALSRAALRLAVDVGAEAVTADAIARSANVSVRTFHNYFATKDEAFLAPVRTLLEHAVGEFRARPPDEPVLDSLEAVWQRLASGGIALPEEAISQVAEHWASPAMAAYQHRLVEEAVRAFAGPVAERTGTDPAVDLYPTVVIAAAVTTIFVAMDHCAGAVGDPERKARAVHEGFQVLRSGFRPPGSTTA